MSTKSGLLSRIRLAGAIVVERIKRSRRDGGQLKWAVDESKRNVKAMSCRHEEGNPYSSVACACTEITRTGVLGGGGKSRVWTPIT
jgi:hypothetical protein